MVDTTSEPNGKSQLRHVATEVLNIGYNESGPRSVTPVVLLHGFPYDIRAFDEVSDRLASSGCHVITPYLRGFGSTRFLSPDTPRSGQQAALAQDLLDLMDALALDRAVLAGYDWGGRAACIVAAQQPQRVLGLVAGTGYSIQDIPRANDPLEPEYESRLWYQYYFHGERGRVGLEKHRSELCELLWRNWSPSWSFNEATYKRTAISFENPDFVAVVIHSYRHRFGLAPGDPRLEGIERSLRTQPSISVPTIVLHGADDGVTPLTDSEGQESLFTGPYERRVIAGAGHNLPQEAPKDFTEAILSLI
jgi:pimeloyl-ACP methyl ester carboxylesterase